MFNNWSRCFLSSALNSQIHRSQEPPSPFLSNYLRWIPLLSKKYSSFCNPSQAPNVDLTLSALGFGLPGMGTWASYWLHSWTLKSDLGLSFNSVSLLEAKTGEIVDVKAHNFLLWNEDTSAQFVLRITHNDDRLLRTVPGAVKTLTPGAALGVVTAMHHLKMRTCSEKCIFRWFCHCANTIEWLHTSLDGLCQPVDVTSWCRQDTKWARYMKL
jgi:hypothetical protein